jgi:hypothetical protein
MGSCGVLHGTGCASMHVGHEPMYVCTHFVVQALPACRKCTGMVSSNGLALHL